VPGAIEPILAAASLGSFAKIGDFAALRLIALAASICRVAYARHCGAYFF